MSLRGQAAIVGISELPTRRSYPGRSMFGLLAEAARLAIEDAGIRKEDVDGIITEGGNVAPGAVAEYMGLRPSFATGVTMQGASGATGITVAASAINAGLCDYVLIVLGRAREAQAAGGGRSVASEFEQPFGPAQGAGTGYALIYQRHMYEFGTTPAQMAKLAADQRFNAVLNPNSAFQGEPITVEDVLNSRYVNAPLHLLECVMPCDGAAAAIVTSAERAKALPNRNVLILGAAIEQGTPAVWQRDRITTTPTKASAARAFNMAGYSPRDMQFAEFYD